MRGEFLDVGGVQLYYYAAGSRGAGEPIVLLHGFPTSGHLWGSVVPLLPAGHRIVVLDLLGYGRSDPPGAVDLRAHGERLVGVLDVLGVPRALLVGHDIGAATALSVAVRHPARVSRLCLVSCPAFDAWPPRRVRFWRALRPLTRHLPAALVLAIARAELRRGYRDHERRGHDVELFLRPFAGAAGRAALLKHLGALEPGETIALSPRLAEVRAPTAIVWGRHDPFLPVTLGQRLHAALPGSTLDVVDDARHFVPQEAPHRVAAAVASLCGRSADAGV